MQSTAHCQTFSLPHNRQTKAFFSSNRLRSPGQQRQLSASAF